MPDGSRRGRRFLKSDKLQVSLFQLPESLLKCFVIPASNLLELLQYLFDFIDISRTFKPGTYRLVILIHFSVVVYIWETIKQFLSIKINAVSQLHYLLIKINALVVIVTDFCDFLLCRWDHIPGVRSLMGRVRCRWVISASLASRKLSS